MIAFLLLLGGCGYGPKAFHADYVAASCEWIAQCGSLSGYGWADVAECEASAKYGDLSQACTDAAADPADCECVDFDADAARACVDAWVAATAACTPVEEIDCSGICVGDPG